MVKVLILGGGGWLTFEVGGVEGGAGVPLAGLPHALQLLARGRSPAGRPTADEPVLPIEKFQTPEITAQCSPSDD